jgi:hypothetical protein
MDLGYVARTSDLLRRRQREIREREKWLVEKDPHELRMF